MIGSYAIEISSNIDQQVLIVPLYRTKIGSVDRFWQLILVRPDSISQGTQFFNNSSVCGKEMSKTRDR